MKILVTGADGFIGSHLVEKLSKLNFDVKAMTLYNSFNNWGHLEYLDSKVLKEIEIFQCDIRDPLRVAQAVKNCGVIIHLAALVAIPFSYVSPQSYIDTNVLGTLNLLNSCIKNNKIKKFIHTSTSEVYGTAQQIPINENHILNAQSPYAASKVAADQLVNSFYHSYNIPSVILRPFNTFGPRQSARAIIPTIITQILSKKKYINLGQTKSTRDFNYIDDTINGFIAAINNNKIIGETINLGSGYELSIKEIFDIICEIKNIKPKINNTSERERPHTSEVMRLIADNNKAKKLLKIKYKLSGRSGIKKGLEKTISWFSKTKNLKQYKSNIYNI